MSIVSVGNLRMPTTAVTVESAMSTHSQQMLLLDIQSSRVDRALRAPKR